MHLAHARASIARGGIFGVGLGNASPLTYALPIAESWHVYAVLGQELDLAGCLIVLALFLLILLRGHCHDAYAAGLPPYRVQLRAVSDCWNAAAVPQRGRAEHPFLWTALGLLLSALQRLHRHERAMTAATDDAPDVPLWKTRRRGIVQLLFVIYALFLVGRLCVIATDDRLERAALFHFERADEGLYSTPR